MFCGYFQQNADQAMTSATYRELEPFIIIWHNIQMLPGIQYIEEGKKCLIEMNITTNRLIPQ
jgi:hypothetical protein